MLILICALYGFIAITVVVYLTLVSLQMARHPQEETGNTDGAV